MPGISRVLCEPLYRMIQSKGDYYCTFLFPTQHGCMLLVMLQMEFKRQRVCRHVILATNDKALRAAGAQMTTIHTLPMHVRPSHDAAQQQ